MSDAGRGVWPDTAQGAGLARFVLAASALAFGGIGAAFLVAPEAMAARVSVALGGPTAANDVRAVYGGLQLAVAVFLGGAAAAGGAWLRSALALQVLAFAGLAGARTLSLAADGNPGAFGLALHAAEVVGLVLGAVAWQRLTRPPTPSSAGVPPR